MSHTAREPRFAARTAMQQRVRLPAAIRGFVNGLKRLSPAATGRPRSAPVRQLAVVSLALAVSACTNSLLDTDLPARTIYVLSPAPVAQGNQTPMPVHLAIGRPEMAPGLDTDRIAVLKGQQLDYYRAARWGSGSAHVVQTLLVDSLEDQRLFSSVTTEQARVGSDYMLDVSVRDFQAEYTPDTSAPNVNIMFVARLVRVVDRQLVGTFVSQARSAAVSNRMHAVAAAFEAAAHQAVTELARETATLVEDDAAKLRAARGEGTP
jgi:cholesterol transport system auxiliary component